MLAVDTRIPDQSFLLERLFASVTCGLGQSPEHGSVLDVARHPPLVSTCTERTRWVCWLPPNGWGLLWPHVVSDASVAVAPRSRSHSFRPPQSWDCVAQME